MNYFSFLFKVFQIIICFFNLSIIQFSNTKELYIDIDNQISEYENNIDFSNFTTDKKLIVLYNPKKVNEEQINIISEKNEASDGKNLTFITKISENNLYKYYENYSLDIENLQNMINLAKNHGIYGFAIYYQWLDEKKLKLLEKNLDLLLNNKNVDFKFMLILENKNFNLSESLKKSQKADINEKFNNDLLTKFINDIKEYLIDKRYIRINQKSVLGIYEQKKIQNLQHIIKLLKLKAKEIGLGELFIIVFLKNNSINYCHNFNFFNTLEKFNLNDYYIIDENNFLNNDLINYKRKEINFSQYKLDMKIFHNNNLKNKESYIFDYNFSPEQFYMFIKIILEYNTKKYESKNRFIFINIWNELYKGIFLETNKKYGFAILNSLSKALFNLPYIDNYNLCYLQKSTKIAIQAHVYYETLISDIIQKTNNIPVQFDLFISTDTEFKKIYIYNYVVNNTKANKFKIQIMNNKGRDVLPLLIQLKNQIKKYKYFCHLHTKKSKHINFGDEWRNYLFNNLLGNKEIISEILTYFENNKYLGIIFPEIYYKVFETFGKNILGSNKDYMNLILKKLAPYLRLSTKNLDFPMGNMFWAKFKSVYQIFLFNLNELIPNENKQLDGTLMHGIERIWLYLAKYNGYYYKKIFKYINI